MLWFQKQNSWCIKSSYSFLPSPLPIPPSPRVSPCVAPGVFLFPAIVNQRRLLEGGRERFPSLYKNGRPAAVAGAARPLAMLFLKPTLLLPFGSSGMATQPVHRVYSPQNREVSLCRTLSTSPLGKTPTTKCRAAQRDADEGLMKLCLPNEQREAASSVPWWLRSFSADPLHLGGLFGVDRSILRYGFISARRGLL